MTLEELRKVCKDLNLEISDHQLDQFHKMAILLKEWNEKINLTAITEEEEVYEKHVLDCLLPLTQETVEGTVCDVGSGGGFPGIVWAIALPNTHFTLVEPTGKKCTYLNKVKEELNLTNVEVVNARAEEFVSEKREHFDVVSARAVANLPMLSELCVPLVKVGGFFYALKGAQGLEELDASKYALSMLGCETPIVHECDLPNGDHRVNIRATKIKHTDLAYPRAYARIKKKPLVGN